MTNLTFNPAPKMSDGKIGAPSATFRRSLIVMGAIVCVSVAAMLLVMIGMRPHPPAKPASPAAAKAEPVLVEFEKLKGKWVRPDGGYVIEIRKLLPDNALEVGYFNPSPIHVGKAKLYKERGFTKVFVELQDVNYPGSTYTLIYDPESDLLRGTYYQATQQQEYQIEFLRMPPGS